MEKLPWSVMERTILALVHTQIRMTIQLIGLVAFHISARQSTIPVEHLNLNAMRGKRGWIHIFAPIQ